MAEPRKMNAMVLISSGDIAATTVETPRIVGDQALIKVTHTGICGTDLKIYRGSIPVKYPLIMGHEIAGKVVECVRNDLVQRGDRVVIDPMLSCGMCFQCRAGQTNLCPHGGVVGRDLNGGFADYIAVPLKNIYRLPESVPNSVAPLIQVVTTCIHSQRLTSVFPGDSVVVLGLGVTGQLQVQLAKTRGASLVIGVSRSKAKAAIAEQHGADVTINSWNEVASTVSAATEGRGADLVIETTGRTEALVEAIEIARPGGRLLLFGINTSEDARIPLYKLYFKELAVFSPRAAKGEDFVACLDLLRSGQISLEPLITHNLELQDLPSAIEMMDDDIDGRLKLILRH